jgi:hypothetical protein
MVFYFLFPLLHLLKEYSLSITMMGKTMPTRINIVDIAHMIQSVGWDKAIFVSTRSRIANPKKK